MIAPGDHTKGTAAMKTTSFLAVLFMGLSGAWLGLRQFRIDDPAVAAGQAAFLQAGCATCHVITSLRGADGLVGPPLDRIASRTYLAGMLTNTPGNMHHWVKNPSQVNPATAMPDLHLSDDEVSSIVAYLLTLR